MDYNKVKEVAQTYADRIRKAGSVFWEVLPERMPEEFAAKVWDEIPFGVERNHHLWMCEEILKGEMSLTKAMRWLGWLNFFVYQKGWYTLEEIKNLSRPTGDCGEDEEQDPSKKLPHMASCPANDDPPEPEFSVTVGPRAEGHPVRIAVDGVLIGCVQSFTMQTARSFPKGEIHMISLGQAGRDASSALARVPWLTLHVTPVDEEKRKAVTKKMLEGVKGRDAIAEIGGQYIKGLLDGMPLSQAEEDASVLREVLRGMGEGDPDYTIKVTQEEHDGLARLLGQEEESAPTTHDFSLRLDHQCAKELMSIRPHWVPMLEDNSCEEPISYVETQELEVLRSVGQELPVSVVVLPRAPTTYDLHDPAEHGECVDLHPVKRPDGKP